MKCLSSFSLALLLLTTTIELSAQNPIFYTRYAGPANNATAQLFALGIGTDTPVQVSLPETAFPAISNSGRFLAVTSSDPQRPNKISQNVYLVDLLAGNTVRRLVEINDTTDPRTGSTTFELPIFKAFSPTGNRVAVTSILQTQGGGGGVSSVPFLRLHDFADGFPSALVVIGQIRTGDYTEMAGVDWSAQENVLATPLRRPSPDGPGQVTAIYRLSPIEDAIANNAFLQISFPQSGSSFQGGVIVNTWENDLLPTFSPSGNQVAYFRTTQSISQFGKSLSTTQLFVVNANGTGTREVRSFPTGLYPTGLSWSPDESRLIVGVAPQQVLEGGFPITQGDFLQSNLVMVNVSDGASAGVGLDGSAFPAWSPVGPTGSGVIPPISFNPAGGGLFTLRGSGADANDVFILESTPNLGTTPWGNQQVFSGSQLSNGININPGNNPQSFFRLRLNN